ncbi:hypothetical protein JCM10020v2_007630 [Rhodotorula toruloides]
MAGSRAGEGHCGRDGGLKGIGELFRALVDVGGREERRGGKAGSCVKECPFEDDGVGAAEGAVWGRGVGGVFKGKDKLNRTMVGSGLEIFSKTAADDSIFCAQRAEYKFEGLLRFLVL